METWLYYFTAPVLSLLGIGAALLLVARDLRKRERPATSLAWIVAIVVAPLVAAPAYLLFGSRKLARIARRAHARGAQRPARPGHEPLATPALLEFYGLPPARGGNDVELLADGVRAYERLLAHIDAAEHSIHIQTFILGVDASGRGIVDALARRARAGVDVCLLVDAVGSWRARLFLLRHLARAGGRVAVFLPALAFWRRGSANLRNHRKIALFDGTHALVGGMNLAREYMGPQPRHATWIDTTTEYRGPVVADVARVFADDWAFATGEDLPPPPAPTAAGDCELQAVAFGPDVPGDPLRDALTAAFYRARERIWICSPYFIPDLELVRVLEMQARAGLDVRICMPHRSDSRVADLVRDRSGRRLAAAGVRLYLHPTRMVHAKSVLVDHGLVVTGTANMDMRSMYLNFELAMVAYDGRQTATTEAWFKALMRECKAGAADPPGTVRRWAEDICWLISPLL
ncbi:MAG: phospholipase D-like domain-containing protein [Gammaproteobacteria bacterium]